jgi:ABC-type hemin transport system ATPase subunit
MADRIIFMENGKITIDEKATDYSSLEDFEKNYANRMLNTTFVGS